MKFLVGVFLAMVLALPSVAQQVTKKNPRVAELEDKYKADIRKYFESRFPQMPYSIEVSIVPLRRDFGSQYEAKQETLPFMEVEEIEYRDEWDDPGATSYDLEARIQRASISVSVPQKVQQEEILEIRDSITKILRLVPARDEVRVARKKWNIGPDFNKLGMIAGGVFLFFLLSQFLIQRASMSKLGKTLNTPKKEKEEEKPAPTPTAMPAPAMMPHYQQPTSSGGSGSISDNVKFRDPIKTRELAHLKVTDLLTDTFFPSLSDMIILQKYAKEDIHGFGGIVQEFPQNIQRKLFAYSPDDSWIEAFAEPGEIDQAGLHVIEKLIRNRPNNRSEDWHTLLVQVWRMDNAEKSKFFDSIDKNEGYAILAAMPKSVAIPCGRKEYPGSWAILLDQNYKAERIPAERVTELLEKTYSIKAKLSKEFLSLYNEEKDLLQYLRKASAQEEREVYEVMENDRFEKLRPPFFRLFEAKESVVEKVFSSFSLEDWSLALFNVSRSDRAIIEKFFGQKEKYLFMEMMKAHDRNKLSPEVSGAVRERVARVVFDLNKERELRKQAREEQKTAEESGNVAA